MSRSADVTRINGDSLAALAKRVFVALGTPQRIARVVSQHLVDANRAGFDSHGVSQLPGYAKQVEAGLVSPDAEPTIHRHRVSAGRIDGNSGWGIYAAEIAMQLAITMARTSGVGVVSLGNCSHIGRLGHYSELAVREHMVGLVTFGEGEAGHHLAAPFGSETRALSTNPISAGVPTATGPPFIADFATTVIANAKTWAYAETGDPLPQGAALDAQGRPTTDAARYLDGGSLVIFGSHKGSAISTLTCLLGALSDSTGSGQRHLTGSTFIAIDVSAFRSPGMYETQTGEFLDSLRDLKPAPGVDKVVMPGDKEQRERRIRDTRGIPISPGVVTELRELCDELDVDNHEL